MIHKNLFSPVLGCLANLAKYRQDYDSRHQHYALKKFMRANRLKKNAVCSDKNLANSNAVTKTLLFKTPKPKRSHSERYYSKRSHKED